MNNEWDSHARILVGHWMRERQIPTRHAETVGDQLSALFDHAYKMGQRDGEVPEKLDLSRSGVG